MRAADTRLARTRRGRLVGGLLIPAAVVVALAGAVGGCGDDEAASTQPNPASGGMNDPGRQGAAPSGSTGAATPGSSTPSGGSGAASPSVAASSTPTAADARADEVDRAFVRQMLPHHRESVRLARLAAKQAEHPSLRQLARTMVADETKESAQLEAFAKELGIAPGSADDETSRSGDALALSMTVDGLETATDLAAIRSAKDFDVAFVDAVSDHLYGAVAITNGEILHGGRDPLKDLASDIGLAAQRDISTMAGWKAKW